MIPIHAELQTILTTLIACESVTDNEKALCDLLEDTLEGCSGTLIREGHSLVLHKDSGKGKRVALVGHIDTVPLGDSTTEAYIQDGSLYGRGACDMKAGLAVMLKIIGQMESGNIEPRFNLSFVFYEGEEGPIPNGINTLIDKGHLKDIDFAFIHEPTEGLYAVGCLGSLTVKKEIPGVSAHSANPRTGSNALTYAFRYYDKISKMDQAIGGEKSIGGLSFYETVNVTSLNTFNPFNVLPSKAEMIVNFRYSSERTLEEAKSLLFKYLGEENTVMIDESDSSYAGKLIEPFLRPGIRKVIMQAWTDIAQLNAAGIPAINYGPGSIKYAHKKDERIDLTDLEDFYISMIKHL